MDESFRQVLPLFRPTAGEFTWVAALAAGLLAALTLGAVASYALTRWRARDRARRSFYAAALERRLSRGQIRLLLELARRHRMGDPLMLLTSLKVFDRHVGRFATAAGSGDGRLDELARVRRRLGFDRPAPDERFYTTRTLAPGQTLLVWPEASDAPGFLQCSVVDRDERAVTAVPLLRDDDRRLSRLAAGDRVKVRFWRRGDTEYRFRTDILEVEPRATTIRIRHAEHLERVQLRDFFRVAVNFRLTLYAVPEARAAGVEPAQVPAQAVARLRGVAVDLSGGGLSARADGEAPPETVLVIDPNLAGPFPIAGLHGEVLDQARDGDGWILRLQFVRMARDRQDDLVAALFSHQVQSALR